ncbi:MAG: hypothetical protein ACRCXM_09240 [Beijerinckiaceae bacterium]
MTIPFFLAMPDPRGRMSRKGFIILMGVLAALEIAGAVLIHRVGLPPDSLVILAIKLAFLWLAGVGILKRTHDLALTGWQVLSAGLGMLIWATFVVLAFLAVGGVDALQSGSLLYLVACTLISLPAIIAIAWLQLAPGDRHANMFGLAPSDCGFSLPIKANGPWPIRHHSTDTV